MNPFTWQISLLWLTSCPIDFLTLHFGRAENLLVRTAVKLENAALAQPVQCTFTRGNFNQRELFSYDCRGILQHYNTYILLNDAKLNLDYFKNSNIEVKTANQQFFFKMTYTWYIRLGKFLGTFDIIFREITVRKECCM